MHSTDMNNYKQKQNCYCEHKNQNMAPISQIWRDGLPLANLTYSLSFMFQLVLILTSSVQFDFFFFTNLMVILHTLSIHLCDVIFYFFKHGHVQCYLYFGIYIMIFQGWRVEIWCLFYPLVCEHTHCLMLISMSLPCLLWGCFLLEKKTLVCFLQAARICQTPRTILLPSQQGGPNQLRRVSNSASYLRFIIPMALSICLRRNSSFPIYPQFYSLAPIQIQVFGEKIQR